MKNKRLFYGIIFAVLVIVEVIIGVFVHDGFVRPYLGDVIVVMAIYALVCFGEDYDSRKISVSVFGSFYIFGNCGNTARISYC